MVDVLDIYFVEHVKKTSGNKAVDDFLVQICQFVITNGDKLKAHQLLSRIIAHTGNQREEISEMLAQSYFAERIHT